MSLQLNETSNQYELTFSKQSHIGSVIGLATVFIFSLTLMIIVGIWIRNKNKILVSILKILLHKKRKEKHKNVNDEATSIFNSSKKHLSRAISIEVNNK